MSRRIILLLGGLTSCVQGQGPTTVTATVEDTVFIENPALFANCNPADGLATQVTDPWIKGDLLMVPVEYSGGCETHTFSACWDQSWAESWPVQTSISLFHGGVADCCEAYLSETISLDLTPLKIAYEDAYQQSSGTISLSFEGYSLDYTFE